MVLALKVIRSTMARQSCWSVKVFGHSENGRVGGDRDRPAFRAVGE
jgi:hypothetical protein